MDIQTALYIASGLGAALAIIGAWAWNHTHARIDKAWQAIDLKASAEELIRVRNTQQQIFEQIREQNSEDRIRHEQIVSDMANMEGKIELILHEIRRK